MKNFQRHNDKAGLTLVEVMVAVVLVATAAAAVYQGLLYSYKGMMRSRARLEAQGIAYDILWEKFNTPYKDLPDIPPPAETLATPEKSIFSTNGIVKYYVLPQVNTNNNTYTERWDMVVQVWAPSNSVLFSVMDEDGTVLAEYSEPLAEYEVIRYKGDR